MLRPIKKGSTNQSVVIRIIDSTTGLPEEAVEHDTAGIALWYRREGETKTTITPAALAALDTAHTDGGIEHIDDGYYRLDPQDTAFAVGSGENGVMIGGTITGMIIIGCYIPLVDYDPYDTVRLGLTALPNAAADAAGGVPISDAGGLDLDSKLANTNEITVARMGALTDWINGGRLDLLLDAIPTTAMRGTDGANTVVPPSVAEFNARSIPSADYLLVSDTLARVTLVDTVTDNTDLVTAASIKTAMEADGGDLSSLMEALVNKRIWEEVNGNLEMFNDAGVSQGTIAAQATSDGFFTTAKRAVI